MNPLTRRKLLAATPGVLGGAAGLGASSSAWAAESYEAATARIWRTGPLQIHQGQCHRRGDQRGMPQQSRAALEQINKSQKCDLRTPLLLP